MPCNHLNVDGFHAIVCAGHARRKRCTYRTCSAWATFECDYVYDVSTGRTCDRAICAAHATEVGADRHYCTFHKLVDEAKVHTTGELFDAG